MNPLRFLLCVLNLSLSLHNPRSCHKYPIQSKRHDSDRKALFVFGDSLFDPGNNPYLNTTDEGIEATSFPYGETYFHRATGRLSDGRIIPDFIAQFAELPILPAFLAPGTHNFADGANFASAGAGVLAQTHPGSINIRMQLECFNEMKQSLMQEFGDVEANKLIERSVYLIDIGGNDYVTFYTDDPSTVESHGRSFVEMVLSNLTLVLKELHGLGARKIAIMNAAPLGRIPFVKMTNPPKSGSTCIEDLSALARLHNSYLSLVLNKLERQLPGFKHALFDLYNSLEDRILNPSKYGFKDGQSGCCGRGPYRGGLCGGGRDGKEEYELCSNPSEYVFFDRAHTTEKANHQLAELIWSGELNVTAPYNLKELFELS